MSTAVIATNITTPDAEDKRAMDYLIELENARRAAANPPEAPLLNSTNAERKTSYEVILDAIMVKAHASYIQQANDSVIADPEFRDLKPLWRDATSAQKAAAAAALIA